MASSLTTYGFALKTRFSDRIPKIIPDRPFLDYCQKDENLVGDGHIVPVMYSAPQGHSAGGVTVAQGAATNVLGKRFVLTAGGYNGSVSIGLKINAQSRSQMGAVMENKALEMDMHQEQALAIIERWCFSNGSSFLGQRLSASGNVISLTNVEDTINFAVGMRLQASAQTGAVNTDVLRAGTVATVTAIDAAIGAVTVDNIANITSFANADYIFREGDFLGGTGNLMFYGLGGYVWDGSGTIPDLYSMVRTTDIVKLGGVRVPAAEITGLDNERRINRLITRMTGVHGSQPADTVWGNPIDFEGLVNTMQNQGYRALEQKAAKSGYAEVTFIAGSSLITAKTSPYTPKGTWFATNRKHLTLMSVGKLLTPIEDGGGNTLHISHTANEWEFRYAAWPALKMTAPQQFGRVAAAAVP